MGSSGGGTTIQYPQQPSYGEGMADAMKAQMQQLLGQGEYAKMYADAGFAGGNLGDIIAGVEGPIRQKTAQVDTDTLRQTLLGSEVKSVRDPETGKYGIPTGKTIEVEGTSPSSRYQIVQITPERYEYQRRKDGFESKGPQGDYYAPTYAIIDTETGGLTKKMGGEKYRVDTTWTGGLKLDKNYNAFQARKRDVLKNISKEYKTLSGIAEKEGNEAALIEYDFINPNTGEPLKAGEVVREGDGMIDLLGDARNVQEFTTRDATQADVDAGLASEVGESITEASGNRQAGFDAEGNFLGLSALAEDIQRGNLSRQREADLADVERLSDRYRGIMEDYKPAATSGLDDARLLIEQQRENLTGLRRATQEDVDAGSASQVGEMFQTGQGQGSGPITMPSSLDSSDYAMTGDAAIGQLDSGEDTLRSALLADARGALSQGLTDREMKQVEESARARQALMGRTFDQKGAIEEAEARIMEDNQRKMQNRAFAQSALGQEAGIQTGDVARAMTADQFNVGAKMDAERLNETLRQQGLSNYINAVGNLAQMEDKFMLDPFQALLGRGGGNALQQGQSVFGQASYGLNSGPQYLNPESGLGYISQMAANNANMYGAQLAADAARSSGLMSGLGELGGGLFGAVGSIFGKK